MAKTKQVMKVEIYGKTIVIREMIGTKFEFRVYEVFPDFRNDHHLESFETFGDAWDFVAHELWG